MEKLNIAKKVTGDKFYADEMNEMVEAINKLVSATTSQILYFKTVKSSADLPTNPTSTDKATAYLLNGDIIVYVGSGGDTLNGIYQNCGRLNGLDGAKGDKGDKGDSGIQSADGIAVRNSVNETYTDSISQVNVLSASVGLLGVMDYDAGECENLAEAIQAVPEGFKKGGLTLHYTTNGKYKKYTLNSNIWSTNFIDWYCEEDEINNLSTYIKEDNALLFLPIENIKNTLDLDGKAKSNVNYHYCISNFIKIKKGQSIKAYCASNSGLLFAAYSAPDENTFIKGSGITNKGNIKKEVEILFEAKYTDLYVRFGWYAQYVTMRGYLYFPIDLVNQKLSIQSNYTFNATNTFEIRGSVFESRSQSRGVPVDVSKYDLVKITPKGSNDYCYFDLLKKLDSISNGLVPKYVNKVHYQIAKGNSAYVDTSDAEYIYFSMSSDLRPNALPINIEYIISSVQDKIAEIDEAMFYEVQPRQLPVESVNFVLTDKIPLEEGEYKLTYNMHRSPRSCYFYDKNGFIIGTFGEKMPEGVYTDEVLIPPTAKYFAINCKYKQSDFYIRLYKKVTSNMNSLNKRIEEVTQKAANSGFRYLADNYGILPTNEDNTEALQKLISKVSYNGGGIIELSIGTFKVAGQLKWESNVQLIGQGIDVTIIKNTCTSGSIQGTFYGDYVNNVRFSDFTIDATDSTSGKGMFMRYIEDGVFENLRIINTIPTGLGIDFLDRVKIINCHALGCGRGRWTVISSGVGCSGIGIGTGWNGHQENFIISNCVCDGNYNNGIFVEDQGRWGKTVMADGTGQIIANNICRNGKNCGFSIWGGKNVTFIGNISYNNSSTGFEIGYYALDGVFHGNQAISNSVGFKISNLSHPTNHVLFTANEVRANKNSGVSIATSGVCDNIVIKDNLFYDNPTGVSISGNSTGLILENNHVKGSTTSFKIADTQTDAVIKGNTYFSNNNNTATYDGTTTFVEQFN